MRKLGAAQIEQQGFGASEVYAWNSTSRLSLTVPPTNCTLIPGPAAANGSARIRLPSANQLLSSTSLHDERNVKDLNIQIELTENICPIFQLTYPNPYST